MGERFWCLFLFSVTSSDILGLTGQFYQFPPCPSQSVDTENADVCSDYSYSAPVCGRPVSPRAQVSVTTIADFSVELDHSLCSSCRITDHSDLTRRSRSKHETGLRTV